MREEARARRRRQIFEAAYTVLADKGYAGTSMLAVARQARASNETLYAWFGSKQGLFQAMVEDNAREAADLLRGHLDNSDDDLDTLLDRLGPALLRLVTDDRAIALNRAAAADADDTGTLGPVIAASGRQSIAPLLADVFARAQATGTLPGDDPAAAAGLYIDLLIGDWQIRRAIGALPRPDAATIAERANRARTLLRPTLERLSA